MYIQYTESIYHCLHVHIPRAYHLGLGNLCRRSVLEETDSHTLSKYWPPESLKIESSSYNSGFNHRTLTKTKI